MALSLLSAVLVQPLCVGSAEVGSIHRQVTYPSYVASGQGLVIVNRYRFIFERFRANRYFFSVLYLCRTALVIQ